MTEKDLPAVLRIEEDSFPHPWTECHFLDEIGSPHGYPVVAVAGAEVVGYLCLKVVLDEAEILDVAVNRSARGRGIGRALVQSALSFCRERGASFLFLEVRAGNAPAQALYRAMGFSESGIRKRYYHDGEDALLMQFDF
ncbi:ribosomal protein S18-alanine N-acetyltransferase [Geomonas sp. RF6]|uniref:ribosomal protein S18-alanine N-acetyltransferase n=1 Tax=Geomonas sp. RF6 TaxID=2897342 RepID=UPI001E4C7052|nr:ribosomal protein S18-alanine N-acetyltransferase [Geomonas sp. RF6]UFS70428.1 ribosomal protein S18-alanine N-acetyltransferase [Geomonas sp. RF6]